MRRTDRLMEMKAFSKRKKHVSVFLAGLVAAYPVEVDSKVDGFQLLKGGGIATNLLPFDGIFMYNL